MTASDTTPPDAADPTVSHGRGYDEHGRLALGAVYLPRQGVHVGEFDFIVNPDAPATALELGTPVTADTAEGPVIGTVIAMRSVGQWDNPLAAEMLARYDTAPLARTDEVMVATVQVLHSNALRPIRSGPVRGASADEVLTATGYDRLEWPVPVGVMDLPDGGIVPIYVEGFRLLGDQAGHLTVGGTSGMASKTSYMLTLLANAYAAGYERGPDGSADPSQVRESVGAVLFNVKGSDLLWLDKPAPDTGRFALTDNDRRIYDALGTPAAHFDPANVFYYAPGLPTGNGTRSARTDAQPLRWSLADIWPYLHYLMPWFREDEKLMSFEADFRNNLLYTSNRHARIATFAALDEWFNQLGLDNEPPTGWGSHHPMTLKRIRRMLLGLPERAGGLLTQGESRAEQDIPTTGWFHGQTVVVDIAGLRPDIQGMVIARTMERLLKEAEEGELGVDHLIVAFDELNTYAPARGNDMAAVKRAVRRATTMGRYAGISVWGAAQMLSEVDDVVQSQAATRALGNMPDVELTDELYRSIPTGIKQRLTRLDQGQMCVTHHGLRPVIVRFPRPAMMTGKGDDKPKRRKVGIDALELSDTARANVADGLDDETVERIVAKADDPDAAVAALKRARTPDLHRMGVGAARAKIDERDPLGLDGDETAGAGDPPADFGVFGLGAGTPPDDPLADDAS